MRIHKSMKLRTRKLQPLRRRTVTGAEGRLASRRAVLPQLRTPARRVGMDLR